MSSVAADARPVAVAGGGLRRRTVAILLALAIFGLYGATTGNLVGYEDETAAVTEGLVKAGELRVLDGTPLTPQGIAGRDGHRYSRTGLTEPVLQAPFYWIGEQLDHIASNGRSYRWRLDALRLYNPAMATLTVLAIFGLLLLRGVSDRRALGVAALGAVATLIWPYSKIGMDTTLMAMLALAVLAAAWTAAHPSSARFALTGIAAGLTVNSKPYGALLLVGVLPFLLGPLRALPKMRPLAACALPLLLGLAVIGWYNWYRTCDRLVQLVPHRIGDRLRRRVCLAAARRADRCNRVAPQPGEGARALQPTRGPGAARPADPVARRPGADAEYRPDGRRQHPVHRDVHRLGRRDLGTRYLVPSAWMLVLPLAWWARGSRRVQALGALAAVGACVQFAGVFANYGVTVPAASALAGAPVYQFAHTAYGDDGPRWVPQASPLLLGLELVAAYVQEHLSGTGFVVSYRPFRGSQGTIDLREPERSFGPLPDFWWTFPGVSAKEEFLAVLLGVLALGSGGMLVRRPLVIGRPPRARSRA